MLAFGWLFMSPAAGDDPLTVAAKQIENLNSAVDSLLKNEFDFYRQNKDGTWSHKPGVLDVINQDASGQKIYFPHLADRNYRKDDNDGINYTDFCSYLCVPTKTSKVKLFSI